MGVLGGPCLGHIGPGAIEIRPLWLCASIVCGCLEGRSVQLWTAG